MRTADKTTKQGFTLVELMVSMMVLSIVMLGVFGLFASQQQHFRSTSDLARGQYNLRVAMFTISRDIRLAGYSGIPLGFDLLNDPANPLFPMAPVDKGGTADITFLPAKTKEWDISNNELQDASTTVDAIDIWANFTRRTGELQYYISGGASSFQVTNSDIFLSPDGDPVSDILIGMRSSVERHGVANVTLSQGDTIGSITLTEPLVRDYQAGAEVVPVIHRRYFVEDRPSITGRGTVRTLIRRDYYTGTYVDVEVAQNINDLQITYELADYEPVSMLGQPDEYQLTNKVYSSIDPENVPDAVHDPGANPWIIRGVSVSMTTISFPRTGESAEGARPYPVFTNMSQIIRTRNIGLEKLKVEGT